MARIVIPHRSFRSMLLLLVLLVPAFVLLATLYTQTASAPPFVLEHPYFRYDLDVLEPRDAEHTRCVLPRIHPFHPSIWGFLSPPKKIACTARRADWTLIDEEGRLKFNESQMRSSGYEVDNSLRCYWSEVQRGGPSGNVDDVISYGKESPLPREGVLLPPDVEIVRVVCRNFASIAIYDSLHARIRDARVATQMSGNFVNVLIFGLDSMSRLGFIRQLPLTYRYLTEDLKMTVLRGMNKVGDNTYPNLVALLTGLAAYGGDLPDPSQGFDGWPLVWKEFSQAGYATLWAEDFPEFGLFNYLAPGFREPPTTHYLRPFWLALKDSPLLKLSSHMCYGATPRWSIFVSSCRDTARRACPTSVSRSWPNSATSTRLVCLPPIPTSGTSCTGWPTLTDWTTPCCSSCPTTGTGSTPSGRPGLVTWKNATPSLLSVFP